MRVYKCTGKVICRNFPALSAIIQKNGVQNLFWTGSYTGIDLQHVDLRFFLCRTELFRTAVLPGYMAAKPQDHGVERLVTPGIQGALKRASMVRPGLTGFSGASDAQYPEMHLGDLESKFPCFVSMVKKPA